ncbi:MAG: hypothetical protein JJU29_00415 [Verrucomicrobia bacterium]|nr:hypothetical protein [Verrucomicrobiota bacterium]MCH8510377.1 hypothetical protein [Kiritimatiellia bacterium]
MFGFIRFVIVFAGFALFFPVSLFAGEILNAQSPWRVHYTWGGPILGSREEPDFRPGPETPAPDSEWAETDFEDADWIRRSGPWFAGNDGEGWGFNAPAQLNLLTLRGKFQVDDPDDAGDLILRLRYRGGVAVFVNGEEVARRHLEDGERDRQTLAEDYPDDVYRHDDSAIPPPREWQGGDFTENVNRRIRDAGEIRIPARHLREGVNVLGLQLHPAAYRSDWARYAGGRANWSTLGLMAVHLQAERPAAITPNLTAPEGINVWGANLLERVGESIPYADPLENGAPIRLVAPRNGVGNAQVVVSTHDGSDVPSYNLTISDLVTESGDRLSSDAFQLRYPGPGLQPQLTDRSSPSAAMLTVRVPPDTAPGRYRGTLTVELEGHPDRERPVQVDVGPWRAPDPRNFISALGVLQSPDTVASQYRVDLWSDEHFEVLEPSIQLLGELGNDITYVPLIRRTHLSNEETMVRWREGRDGNLEPDLSVLRRYLEMVDRHAGPQSALVLYLYEGGNRPVNLVVTRVDANGNTSEFQAPQYGSEGAVAFWKPVFDGIREIVNDLDWSEEALQFGVFGDSWAQSQSIRDFFEEAAPDIRWAMFTHARGHPRPADGELTVDGWDIGYRVLPYWPDFRRFPQERFLDGFLRMGQDFHFYDLSSARALMSNTSHPGTYMTAMEMMMTTERFVGLSRIALDFWAVDGNNPIIGRYQRWHNLYRGNPRYFTHPGPEGAVGSVRYEALRTGLQENEAALLLDRAYHHHADQLDEALLDRVRANKIERITHFVIGEGSEDTWDWFAGSGWQARALELYQLAAEVADAIGE